MQEEVSRLESEVVALEGACQHLESENMSIETVLKLRSGQSLVNAAAKVDFLLVFSSSAHCVTPVASNTSGRHAHCCVGPTQVRRRGDTITECNRTVVTLKASMQGQPGLCMRQAFTTAWLLTADTHRLQADQLACVGPTAAVPLARLLTLLRSPNDPVPPEDVQHMRVQQMPAIGQVSCLQHKHTVFLCPCALHRCWVGTAAFSRCRESSKGLQSVPLHGDIGPSGSSAQVIVCHSGSPCSAVQEVIRVAGGLLEEAGDDTASPSAVRAADIILCGNEVRRPPPLCRCVAADRLRWPHPVTDVGECTSGELAGSTLAHNRTSVDDKQCPEKWRRASTEAHPACAVLRRLLAAAAGGDGGHAGADAVGAHRKVWATQCGAVERLPGAAHRK